MRRVAIGLVAVCSLSGCATYSLEELRRVEPVGTPFQKALSRHYKEFAISEEKQYDWTDSMHFADKGLRAAYGKDVEPENPAHWDIAANKAPEIQLAYESLNKVLAGGVVETKPEIAARAQYYFDCWLEQQEEGWQEVDISYCRDGFKDTMDTLLGRESDEEIVAEIKDEEVVVEHKTEEKPQLPQEPAKEVEAEKPAVAPVMADAAAKEDEDAGQLMAAARDNMFSYVVFFEKKQSDISAAGKKAIDDVLSMAKAGGEYTFILNSHTDRVGEDIENQKLTEDRAKIVRDALVRGGIDTDDIKIYAFGESDIPVKTADGVDEPANQRVEILLNE